MSKKNKNWFFNWDDTRGKISIIISAILAISFLPTLISKVKEFIAKINAKSATKDVLDEFNNNSTGSTSSGIRHTFVEGVIESILKMASFYNDDEEGIVSEMNTLNNDKEAVYASQYFKKTQNKSLKAWLMDKLDSDSRPDFTSKGQRFKDIKSNIRPYLT